MVHETQPCIDYFELSGFRLIVLRIIHTSSSPPIITTAQRRNCGHTQRRYYSVDKHNQRRSSTAYVASSTSSTSWPRYPMTSCQMPTTMFKSSPRPPSLMTLTNSGCIPGVGGSLRCIPCLAWPRDGSGRFPVRSRLRTSRYMARQFPRTQLKSYSHMGPSFTWRHHSRSAIGWTCAGAFGNLSY